MTGTERGTQCEGYSAEPDGVQARHADLEEVLEAPGRELPRLRHPPQRSRSDILELF